VREIETIPALRRFLAGLPPAPVTRIIHAFFLRSLRKAVYSPIDIGHFGLGIDRYCHFTSPIRRYPDLFNHRIVRSLIRRRAGEARNPQVVQRWQEAAIRHARDSSQSEQVAEKAERELIRLKSLRWAEERLGERFAGHVVGLIPAGLFVELDKVPVEGFLPREGVSGGARFVEERLAFVDRRVRFELCLGNAVEVVIARVDLRERRLDLELAPESGRSRGSRHTSRGAVGRAKGRRKEGGRRGGQVKRRSPRADRGRGRRASGKSRRGRPRRGGG
jgi:ribonuclease R